MSELRLTASIFQFNGGFPSVSFGENGATVTDAGFVRFTNCDKKPSIGLAKELIRLSAPIRKREGFPHSVVVDYQVEKRGSNK